MRQHHAGGFSLMEIMVVVAIIGMVTAAVILTMSGSRRDTQLDQEAERLAALFSYVREQAELQTRDYGFRANQRSYSFVVFDAIANQWRPVEEDDALRERDFPDGIQPLLVVEGRTVVLDTRPKNVENFSPHIIIFANGDLTSFEVHLQREDAAGDLKARLYTDEQSNIHLLLPGEVEPSGPAARTVAVP